MFVGKSRILVDQLSRHRKVTRDILCVLLAQSLQLVASCPVEVTCRDVIGDLRFIEPRTLVGRLSRTLPARSPTLRERPGLVAVAAIAARGTTITVVATLAAGSCTITVVPALAARSTTITVVPATLTARSCGVSTVAGASARSPVPARSTVVVATAKNGELFGWIGAAINSPKPITDAAAMTPDTARAMKR